MIQQVYLADRTCAEAAVVLGIPVGTVKSRLHYVMRNLRLALQAQPSQTQPAGPGTLRCPETEEACPATIRLASQEES